MGFRTILGSHGQQEEPEAEGEFCRSRAHGSSRYSQVSVRRLPSGREKSASFDAGGKAAARRQALAVARRLVEELRQR
jgi:hypothetical protein